MAGAKSNSRVLSSDGRLRRGERSREAIVAALFELVGEGVLEPTAQQVAERARVGIRSVFRHFDDMDGLFATMDERLRADAVPILREASSEGTLRERARALVDRRVRLFERIAPYKRSAGVQRWRSPFLSTQHSLLVRELRAALLRALPELSSAPSEWVDALDVLLSFEAWDRLRTDQRLSRERAEAALERAVLALVERAVR
jgi:AcrR family transcriptional regulator